MLDIEQIIYVSILHQELIMEIDQTNIEVASGAIVPSKCGEMAFRVVKKVRSEKEQRPDWIFIIINYIINQCRLVYFYFQNKL